MISDSCEEGYAQQRLQTYSAVSYMAVRSGVAGDGVVVQEALSAATWQKKV